MSTTVKKLMDGIRVATARTNKNSGTGYTKTSVTAHWWDDPGRRPSFGGTVEWLRRSSVQASIQCVAEAGRITYMERDDAAAWHAGSSAGNRTSWAIEINPRLSEGDYRTAAAAIARFWLERNSGNPTPIFPHRHWSATSCPGHMDMGKLERYALEALSGGSSSGGSSSGGSSSGGSSSGGSSSGGSSSSGSSRKTDRQLAQEVIDGKHGNGAARQRSLGSRYSAVQAEVNRILNGSSSSSSSSGRKSIRGVAQDIVNGRGNWGNEPQRSQRLRAAGYDAAAVQREVNAILRGSGRSASSGSTASKSVSQLATEVMRGDWGNEPQRSARLRNAGHNPAAVQREVNRRLS